MDFREQLQLVKNEFHHKVPGWESDAICDPKVYAVGNNIRMVGCNKPINCDVYEAFKAKNLLHLVSRLWSPHMKKYIHAELRPLAIDPAYTQARGHHLWFTLHGTEQLHSYGKKASRTTAKGAGKEAGTNKKRKTRTTDLDTDELERRLVQCFI